MARNHADSATRPAEPVYSDSVALPLARLRNIDSFAQL